MKHYALSVAYISSSPTYAARGRVKRAIREAGGLRFAYGVAGNLADKAAAKISLCPDVDRVCVTLVDEQNTGVWRRGRK